ncbi:Molybdenum cofactor sulfurase, partial [Geodia barretti]
SHKVFGFPTGLGALLVRRDSAPLLFKRYYGGGTVFGTVSRSGLHLPRSDLHERLEDGTIPFLEILALEHGFQTLSKLAGPMTGIADRTFTLAKYVHDKLSVMKHYNGAPLCIIYCHENFTDPSKQGGIVNFNLLRPDGKFVGYSEVSNLASVHDIHLRTGCFCNTGACMNYLHLDTSLILNHLEAGHICGDSMDIINGKPTGSVRVSFGYMSTLKDAKTFVSFVESNFQHSTETSSDDLIDRPSTNFIGRKTDDVIVKECGDVGDGRGLEVETVEKRGREGRWIKVGDKVAIVSSNTTIGTACKTYKLDSIRLYPVKSCGSLEVSEWLIGGCGLLYDREWVVLSEHRACLSQKQEPRLSLVLPFLTPHSQHLELRFQGKASLKVSLARGGTEEGSNQTRRQGRDFSLSSGGAVCQMRVCGDKVTGTDCGEAAASWLTEALSRDCRLVRQTHQRTAKTPSSASGSGEAPLLSLANEAQYLLVTRASAEYLLSEISKRHTKQVCQTRKARLTISMHGSHSIIYTLCIDS